VRAANSGEWTELEQTTTETKSHAEAQEGHDKALSLNPEKESMERF
jgi:hypothetical protein